MSQENVEVVRRVVDAFNRQDWVAWASNWHQDAEWYDPPEVPGSGVHRGLESIRRYFDELLDLAAYGRWNVEVDAVESLGPRCVLIRARMVVVGRGSGMPTENALFQVVDLEDGRLRRVRNFLTDRDALDAAGLRE
jgi:ketosteroid isomerase-like protein